MYAIAVAATAAPIARSSITLRELKAASEAGKRGRIYVRSFRIA